MATATIEGKTEHVYEGMLAVLRAMSVEKGGQLPANMGGKSYITASDLSAEAKRQFVENDLVLEPSERVYKHEAIIFKDRLNILIVIEGTYRLTSVRDGSTAVISGVGDGLATGTAVASNIASTNALKNALLRTFLITEQSVEDAAKNGTDTEGAPQNQAVARAAGSTIKPPTKAASEIDALRAELKAAAEKAAAAVGEGFSNDITGTELYKLVAEQKKLARGWPNRPGDLKALTRAITNGDFELPEK